MGLCFRPQMEILGGRLGDLDPEVAAKAQRLLDIMHHKLGFDRDP